MPGQDAYISLITSLPGPERLFQAKLPPLSRLRLEKKLGALTPEDRALLRRIEGVMAWGSYAMADGDAVAIARAKALLGELGPGTLGRLVRERIDMRATIAALRLRRRGLSAPSAPWSASRLSAHIIAHWAEPDFKLGPRLPWLGAALPLFEAQDPLGLERYLLDITYRQLQRHGARHHFDFEAVVIYVLKWSIYDRWAQADPRAASARFEALTQAAMAQFDMPDLEAIA